jgi:hypothetical protein
MPLLERYRRQPPDGLVHAIHLDDSSTLAHPQRANCIIGNSPLLDAHAFFRDRSDDAQADPSPGLDLRSRCANRPTVSSSANQRAPPTDLVAPIPVLFVTARRSF